MEGYKPLESFDSQQENQLESVPTFKQKCVRRISLAGLALTAGLFVTTKVKEHIDTGKWHDHIEQSFNAQEKESMKENERRIIEIFDDVSDRVLEDIRRGDQNALMKKDEEAKAPVFKNFKGALAIHVQEKIKEAETAYPKGWVNGEIGEVIFDDDKKITDEFEHKTGHSHEGQGEFHRFPLMGKPYLKFSRTDWTDTGMVAADVISHELGHANDWESDSSLNLQERYQLLLDTHSRLTSPDAYHRENDQYHELYDDGSDQGKYISTMEYWAEICSQYFSDPNGFKTKHPKDYDLVDRVVKKNDPAFDVTNRIQFDPMTGEKLKKNE